MVNSVNGVDVTALVVAARDGDQGAGERLAALYLPLVYNVVGRALNGHPDVDDVVQETMLRALSGLSSLRDPTRFRSWLVAIAMNQVRTRWSVLGHRPAALEEADEPADPAADFVDLTILRLELSGQRRETAEATRWLDDAERDVLSLWWLETTGELTRAELAEALGLSPQHAAVRVQRVKNQLDVGRAVVRALAAEPRCPILGDLVADWDGAPTPLWRKRIARHIRGCASCSAGASGLVPPEGLLSGLALVVPLYEGGQHAAAAVAPAVAPAAFSAGKAAGLVAAAAAVTSIAVLLWPSAPAPPAPRAEGGTTQLPAPAPVTTTAAATPSVSPTPTATPSPTPSPTAPSASPSTVAPPPSPSAAPRARPRPETLLVAEVNTLRAHNDCPQLTTDPRLTEVAQRHSEDMAARDYFDHTDSTGRNMGDRVTDSGYRWTAVGETIATGNADPAAVAEQWRRSPGRDDDILNCNFTHVGVGIADSPRGPYWTQVLATPQ
ncbi:MULTISPECIES: sigma-70 family RNA polymerase sigma factor [Streptomyces]|uniref:sigma-70 family RNA polymerase sigma factor n=1 Tax=Streptomyces TaxID=1883 RepID=UPI000D5178F6|nr:MULTISPECIES: sigma-70 family RNA polymerase sigma factor [Streptomyces]MXG28275.1 sigma-70 family RNA polymerase sigma factor [Streptomyces sp. YIM 132580]PVC67177.1 RNA polymerase [Streptomyces sp. CS065A]